MPRDQWKRVARIAGNKMPVAMANPNGRDLDQHFAGLRLLKIDLLNPEGFTRGTEDGGFDLHAEESTCRGFFRPSAQSGGRRQTMLGDGMESVWFIAGRRRRFLPLLGPV